jgi:outer membrane receptor protein involved in Fe transport
MRRSVISFVGLALAIGQLLAPSDAYAQAGRAHGRSLNGIVRDALGRAIPGVEVSLQSANGHLFGKIRSNNQGEFSFPGVTPGTYAIIGAKATFKPATAIVTATSSGAKLVALAMASEEALNLAVVARRLDRSRNSLSPTTGGSSYTFTQKAIQELPQGNNTPLNQVLLQAPGVVQDSFGQIHVRGDHADLQYRIDGVQLPEGIIGFTNTISTRFANSISLLDGALPAEFGYRTAGIVDIHTKSGTIAPGGDIDFYGGQRETWEPSFEYGGTGGKFSYYVTGTYLHDTRGIEPPTTGPSPDHDKTEQGRFFGDFSYFFTPTLRLTFLTGTAVTDLQIPGNANQPTVFNLFGVPNNPKTGLPIYNSLNVREGQLEQNYFNVLALQGAFEQLDYQISAFSRYSTIHFRPDDIGDLVFNGAASDVFRSSFVNGLQGDASYHLGESHTIRSGFYFSGENAYIGNNELVFPANPDGTQASNVPANIVDNGQITDWLYGVYLQDEWRPTEQLTINYGARFDLSDAFVRADQFSPRFGVVYKFPTKTTLHAAYARYFTPPQTEVVTDVDIKKFVGTTGQPPTLFNSLPVPARDHYFDAGVTQQIGSSINLGLDSYYKMSRNLLDEGQFGPALVFTPINYQKGRVYGVEATGSYTKGKLSTYANFTYSVAQGTNVESGQVNFEPDELEYIANHYVFLDHDQTFSTSVGASYRWQGFMFTADSLYASGLRDGFANTGNLLPYFIVNAGVTKSFVAPRVGPLEARVAVVNLFDHTYQIRNGTGIGVFAAQYGERRAVYGGLKWEIPPIALAGTGAH